MKAKVVFGHAGWVGEDGRRQGASQGQVVDLPTKEFDRLVALGAVVKFAGGGGKEPLGQADYPQTRPRPVVPDVGGVPLTKRTGNRATAPKSTV